MIFVSHSDKDMALYTTTKGLLASKNFRVWDVQEMTHGISLSEQIQTAVGLATHCVFLATKNSTESLWCLTEIGAFWGAKKPVIVFLGDTDFSEDKLPPQLQGLLHTSDAEKLIEALLDDSIVQMPVMDTVTEGVINSRIPADPVEPDWGPEVSDMLRQVRTEAQAGNFQHAYDLSSQVVQLSPNCARAHGNMATALVHLRRFNEAIEKYREIVSRFPDHSQLVARTLHNLAWAKLCWKGMDDEHTMEKCKDLFLRSLALDNTRLPTRAQYLVCLAILKEHSEAEQFLRASVKQPGFLDALRNQVSALDQQGFDTLSHIPEWLQSHLGKHNPPQKLGD